MWGVCMHTRREKLTSFVEDLVSPCSPMACLNILNSFSVTGDAAKEQKNEHEQRRE